MLFPLHIRYSEREENKEKVRCDEFGHRDQATVHAHIGGRGGRTKPLDYEK